MDKVAIVTDSTASIPEELVKQYGIQRVSLLVHMDGKTYKDRIDLKTPDELFQLMKQASKFPTTSTPPPGEYAELYRRLSRKVKNVLAIAISSELSASFKSAVQAKEMLASELPDINIQVFDSRTSVGALGLIVLAAARAAASGQDMAGVVKVAEDIRSKVDMLCVFDTMSYLVKSGRLSKAVGLAGSMLSVKPISGISTSLGKPLVVARPRTKKKALQVLLEMVKERVGTTSPVHVMVEHTCVPQEAEGLKQTVLDQFNCAEVLLCEYSPLSSLIVGPGLLGLDFYQG